MTTPVLLSVEHVSQTLGLRPILRDISCKAAAGTIVAFLGPNGAGKTTLLKTIIGLHRYQAPTVQTHIYLDGIDVLKFSVQERVARGLIYVPQQTSLFLSLSVEQNLMLVFEHHPYWQLKNRSDFIDRMQPLLEQTELIGARFQKARYLSGGQQRKVEIIRALLMQPRIILLDEPFAGVDPKSIYELKSIFLEMANQGIALIISDHHVDQLLSIAHQVYVIINGQVVTSGKVHDIMENEELKKRYFGSQFHAEVADRFL